MKKLTCALLSIILFTSSFGQSGSFQFTVSAGATHTSAGVFNKANGNKIRNLWSDSLLTAGTHTSSWDGKDDWGVTASLVPYEVKVLSNNVSYNWDGVIGNTSSTNVGTGVHRGYYTSITGMAATGTTVYFCQGYSERYSSQAKFSTSAPQTRLDLAGFTGNTSTMNCDFVATDGTFVYWAGYDSHAVNNSFVSATRVSNDAQVSFGANGSSITMVNNGPGKTYTSVIDRLNVANSKPSGLDVQSSGNYLFVAHSGLNQLHVLDKTTGALVQNLSYTAPRYLSVEGSNLWMVTGTNTIAEYTVNANGTLTAAMLTISAVVIPGAIKANGSGTLAVIDQANQVVRFFNTTTGVESTQVGTNGGYSTSPDVTNFKYMFNDFRGNAFSFISYMPDGSFWFGDPGDFRELHFTSGKTYIETIQSLGDTYLYSTCVDPNNISRAFVGFLEFSIDYSQPLTGSTGWSFVKNWGYSVPSSNYTNTKKLLNVTTLSNGRTYGFDYSGGGLKELASAGLISSAAAIAGGIINKDGSLTRFTGSYNIGSTVTYTKYALTGFSGNTPQWSASGTVLATTPTNTIKSPNNFPGNVTPTGYNFVTSSGKVIFYNPSLYIGGATTTYWDGMHLGAITQGTAQWLWQSYKANARTYNGNYPAVDVFEIGNNVNQNAGSNANIVGNNIIAGYHGEFWKNGQTNYFHHYWEDGLAIGRFGTDFYKLSGNTNVYPLPSIGMAANAVTPCAVQGVTSDTIYLYHGDESYHAGLHRWTISNLSSISEQTVQIGVVNHNYYFSNSTGDDSRTAVQAQNSATPWKTIAKFNANVSTFNAGDSALFKRGDTWTGTTMYVNKKGVIVSDYGIGVKPIFSGMTTLSGWTNVGAGVYESGIINPIANVSVVTINDSLYGMGRFPNIDNTINRGYLYFQSHSGTTSITSNQLTGTPSYVGAELVIKPNRFTMLRFPITAQTGGTLTYNGTTIPTDGYGFFIQNSPNVLDAFGEWYYNPVTKKVRVYFGGSNPTGYTVQANVLDTLISIRGIDSITVNNIDMKGAGFRGVDNYNSNATVIKNCFIKNSGNVGIFGAFGKNLQVFNDTIKYTNGCAIDFTNAIDTSNIYNNVIVNSGTISGAGDNFRDSYSGIVALNGDRNYIQGNKLDSIGFAGIRYSGNRDTIRNNYIRSFAFTIDDVGAIYQPVNGNDSTLSTTYTGISVTKNVITNGIGSAWGTNQPGTGSANGIYLDDNTNHVTIDSNSIARCFNAGIYVHNAKQITITRNNIFSCGVAFQTVKDNSGNYNTRSLIVNNNKFVAQTTTQKAANFKTALNDINLFGTINNNVYARPIDDNLSIQTVVNSNVTTQRNLAGWVTFSGHDAASTKSPRAIVDTASIIFRANPIYPTFTLAGNWTDLLNVAYNGTPTLQPYTSVTLIPASAAQLIPTINWGNPANITVGTALSGTQLNATVTYNGNPVAGTITYTPPSGTFLGIGQSQPLQADFVPTDGVTYANATKTVYINVSSGGGNKVCIDANDGTGIYLFNHTTYNGSPLDIYPGDTLCINAGTYSYMQLNGLVGTAAQPIVIINNGQVYNTGNNGTSYCYLIQKSRFFKWTGTGTPGITYGFQAHWTGGYTGAMMNVRDSTTDYEIDHFEGWQVGNGFLCKIDPTNNERGTWRGNWTIANVKIHDNYVHGSTGEVLYGINTDQSTNVDSLGTTITVLPVPGTNWEVYNNRFDTSGWDGIQLASCTGCSIHDNYVHHFGTFDISSQQAGIILGGRSNGWIYNNDVGIGTGNGIEYYGWALDANMVNTSLKAFIYNNIIDSVGWSVAQKQDGVYFDGRPAQSTGLVAYVMNNTITNPGRYGVNTFNSVQQGNGSRINNNLIVHPASSYVNIPSSGLTVDTTFNQRISTITAANFTSYATKNFLITGASPAFDAGESVASVLTTDIVGTNRPQNLAYDCGAYEFIPSGTKITPTITWPDLTTRTYGSLIVAGDLNATSGGVAGTYSYSISVGQLYNQGFYTFTVLFTPSDPFTYNSATGTTHLTVTPRPITGTFSNMTQTFNNIPLLPTVTTSPVAGVAVDITLNGTAGGRIAAGNYAALAGTPDPNYSMPVISGTFTITPKAGTFTVSNTVYTYDSLLHTVSVSTSDPAITYTITGAPQRYSGSYTVTIHNTNPNFNVPDAVVTLTINKGTTSLVSWTPANMTYNAAIGASQTNAVFAKDGVSTYTPTTGFIPNAGILPMRLDFVPNDTNLNPINGIIRNVTVSKGTDVMSLTSDTTQYFDGNVKTVTVNTLHGGTVTVNYTGGHTAVGDYPFTATYFDANWQAVSVSGTLHILSNAANIFITNFANRVYTGSPIDVTVTSAYTYDLVYNPTNHTDVNNNIQVIATINDGIHTGADTVIMSIIKATPISTWAAISDGVFPYVVGSGILNANTSVPGSWSYSVNVGDTLSVGDNIISATFTPTDGANYNSITITNTVAVTTGTAIINVGNLSQQYDGSVKYISTSTTPPNLDSLIITYTGNHKDAGSYPVTIQLNNANYTATTVSTTLVISQGSYQLSWARPQPIQVGSPITAVIYNPTSTIPGTFTFNYPLGYIPPAGTIGLVATFHPTDSSYPDQTITTTLSVYGSPFLNYFIIQGKTFPVNYPNQ